MNDEGRARFVVMGQRVGGVDWSRTGLTWWLLWQIDGLKMVMRALGWLHMVWVIGRELQEFIVVR